ncbi:uncharacterized protein BYT42DRAFT_496947 [Radiomyces spectabilis]|uniref:uncharacterized protein n=1 Tax=Radiomyces spectabilis TaxID=64574 RepID=UPI00221FDB15|nr:uncharacterized protein BYT42DRAFT_496947 [Radiomyces spectabilis]KAI8378035.1 hypothetical protein BYT42DRAFT_496947 [Radiomyces spectabilis]
MYCFLWVPAVRSVTTASSETAASDIITHNHPTEPLAKYNLKLVAKLRNPQHVKEVLRQVLRVVEDIKAANLKMDITSYNALLKAYAQAKESSLVLETLKTMKSQGVQPTAQSYAVALEVFAKSGKIDTQEQIVRLMKEDGLAMTPQTYMQILKGYCQAGSLKNSLATMQEMKDNGIEVGLAAYGSVINCCFKLRKSQTAFDLLKQAEEENLALNTRPQIYMDVMRAAAWNDEFDNMVYCWKKTIEHSLRADEGSCLDIMRVAAKAGETVLITEVIGQLSKLGFTYKEHYFTPLMESFVLKDDWKSAFHVLEIMRSCGVHPTMRSTIPIQSKLSKDINAIDAAYYVLEELHNEGMKVDVTAFNVVVAACAEAKDLQRTVATYREASNLGVTPDVDTYNAVLEACVQTRMKGMGNVVIEEMKKAGIAPNVATYSRMIALSCTQQNYEDAFTYLEEMKGYGVIPPESSYVVLVRKLAAQADPRFFLALEEMETYGYQVSPKIRALWRQ